MAPETAVRKEPKKQRTPRVDWAKLLRRTESVGCLHLCLVWGQAPGVGVPDGPQRSTRHSGAPVTAHAACCRWLQRRGHPSSRGVEPRAVTLPKTPTPLLPPPGVATEPACAPGGRTVSPPARPTALVAPVSCPPLPLGSSPLPPHDPHSAYTLEDLVQIWVRRERCTSPAGGSPARGIVDAPRKPSGGEGRRLPEPKPRRRRPRKEVERVRRPQRK